VNRPNIADTAKTDNQPIDPDFLTRRYSIFEMLSLYSFLAVRFCVGVILRIGGFPLRKFLYTNIGTLIYKLMGKKRRIARINLNIAFGDEKTDKQKEEIILGMFRHFVRFGIDMLFSEIYFPPEYLAEIPIDHPEYLEQAKAHGKGVIGIGAHLGNWELSGAALVAKGLPCAPIVKRISSPIFDRIYNEKRLAYGFELLQVPEKKKVEIDGEIVEIKGSLGPQIGEFLLKRRGGVGFFIDQYAIQKNRVEVPVFGTLAPTQVGTVKYALEFGSPCLHGTGVYDKDGMPRILFQEPIFVEDKGSEEETFKYWMTEFTQKLEIWIRQYPEQWAWGHRRYYRDNYK
jgi:Kdo2-lipid IVA lauroyltransferase/acyltransferase